MNQSSLVDRLRSARHARSVLKTKLVTLRGRLPTCPILVFEGDDDKVVYGRWIARLKPDLHYAAFVCKGKRGVATVQRIVRDDLGSLDKAIYLFIDRDFDDDTRFISSDDLFMTDYYAVENYLVCPLVLGRLLRDEFPCHELPDLIDKIVAVFRQDYDKFLDITTSFNNRLFIIRRTAINVGISLPTKIGDYASVSIGNIMPALLPCEEIIPKVFAIPKDLNDSLEAEFMAFDPRERFRGKNALLFLFKWLDLLIVDLETRAGVFAGASINGKVRKHELTLGTLAARSRIPSGLAQFADRIAA